MSQSLNKSNTIRQGGTLEKNHLPLPRTRTHTHTVEIKVMETGQTNCAFAFKFYRSIHLKRLNGKRSISKESEKKTENGIKEKKEIEKRADS